MSRLSLGLAEPKLPERPPDTHPLGLVFHLPADPRSPECFEAILFRLVTGCSWDVAGRLGKGSETTLRSRFNEWLKAGVFEALADEAIEGFDKIIGLDLSETVVDGSVHTAPMGGEGTGKSPVDRGKIGWRWSTSPRTSAASPIGWTSAGANIHDSLLLGDTLDAVARRGLLGECETLHLDRGYDDPLRPGRLCGPGTLD